MIFIAAYSAYFLFFYIFWYNIHSLDGVLLWFRSWVVDAAYSAIKLFFLIEFSMSLIRQVAPLICFFRIFCFSPKKT